MGIEKLKAFDVIKVDFLKTDGIIKPMNAVNNGPAGSAVRGTGNFASYKEAEIPYARLHDSAFYSGYGGEWSVDVHRIFRNFDADENDPNSYVFEPTDKYLENIVAAGTKVFYRLGAAIEHGYKYGTKPPKDFLKWAKICEHIIRHYNEGWANGFHYDIEYWEIWNEFDCHNADGTFPCWQGTFSEFGEFYSVVARYLKNTFPHLKIGGPAFASVWNPVVNQAFFEVMQRDNVPIDFISYHAYMRNVQDLKDTVAMANKVFKQYGYGSREKILNEWNYIKGWAGDDWKYSLKMERTLKGSSFVGACMAVGQTLDLDMLMYYDARPCGMNGMFDTNTLQPLKSYYTFKAFAGLKKLVNYVKPESDCKDIYACAATNGTDNRLMFTFFKEDDNYEKKTVKVDFKGIKNSSLLQAKVYLIDENNDLSIVREEIFTSENFSMYFNLELFGTYYIEISPIK